MLTTRLIGALTAVAFLASASLVFVFRLVHRPAWGNILGWFEIALVIPLVYLLVKAPAEHRGALYIIQICAILAWLLVELLLDYVLKVDFRGTRWAVITYVMLFFAGCGGLVGIASIAGRPWNWISIALFLVTAALAFIQRRVTGQ